MHEPRMLEKVTSSNEIFIPESKDVNYTAFNK